MSIEFRLINIMSNEFHEAFKNLLKSKLPMKIASNLKKIANEIQAAITHFNEIRNARFEQLADVPVINEDGSPVIDPKTGKPLMQLSDANVALLNKELADFVNEPITINANYIAIEDLESENIKLSAEELILFDFFLKSREEIEVLTKSLSKTNNKDAN
jgi:hypothetical protein